MPLQVLFSGQPVNAPARLPGSRNEVTPVEDTSATRPIHPRVEPEQGEGEKGGEGQRKQSSRHQARDYLETAASGMESGQPLRAGDCMSRSPFSIHSDTTVQAVRDAFRSHRFRYIPVVDGIGRIQGIISDRDLWNVRGQDNQPISEHMVKRVMTASPETTLQEIARALLDFRIGAMPVRSSDNKLLGIITRSDVLRAIVHQGRLHLEV